MQNVMMRVALVVATALFAVACAAAPTPVPTQAPPTAAPKPTEAAKPTAAPATAVPPTNAPTTASQPTAAPAATKAAPASVTVKFGQVGGLSDAAIFIAEAKGFFKEQGITVEYVPFTSAAQMVAPLGTNELQIGGGAISAGLFNAFNRDVKILIVADKGNQNPGNGYEAYIVRKDLADQIKGPKDLKGRTVALAARDISPEYSLDAYLRQGGLTINDVNVVTMGHPDMLSALQNKAIDVGAPIEPTLSRTLQAGVGTLLTRVDAVVPGIQVAVILYSQKFATDQRDAATRFMFAYLKGARLYNDAFTKKDLQVRKDVVDILAKATKLDASLFDTMYVPGIDPNGKVNVKSTDDIQQWFVKKGSLNKVADLEKLIDMSFANDASKQLGPYK